MARPLDGADVVFEQRFLKCAGLYRGRIDAIWGPLTNAADVAFHVAAEKIACRLGRFDARSERHIASLQLPAQEAARRFLDRASTARIDVRIISGTRSYAEQDALYRRGRYGHPGPRVTNARGGQSRHNFGIAWDIGVFEGGRYLTDPEPYERVGAIALEDSIAWGGHWRRFIDRPHYELALGLSVAELRRRFEAGEPFLPAPEAEPLVA